MERGAEEKEEGEVLNRFLGDESVSLPDTTSIQLLHVHIELLQSFLFFFRYLYKGILYIFFGIYCTYIRSGLFRSRFFFLIFYWIARSQAIVRNVQYSTFGRYVGNVTFAAKMLSLSEIGNMTRCGHLSGMDGLSTIERVR